MTIYRLHDNVVNQSVYVNDFETLQQHAQLWCERINEEQSEGDTPHTVDTLEEMKDVFESANIEMHIMTKEDLQKADNHKKYYKIFDTQLGGYKDMYHPFKSMSDAYVTYGDCLREQAIDNGIYEETEEMNEEEIETFMNGISNEQLFYDFQYVVDELSFTDLTEQEQTDILNGVA